MRRLLQVYRQDGVPDEGDSIEKWREGGKIRVWLVTERGLWIQGRGAVNFQTAEATSRLLLEANG